MKALLREAVRRRRREGRPIPEEYEDIVQEELDDFDDDELGIDPEEGL